MNAVAAQGQTCLLILPRGFYSFAQTLARGLKELGFETVIANDEYPENLFGKIISKLGLPLSHRITRRVLVAQVLEGHRYDLILVIKGRGLDAETAQLLNAHAHAVVGYHFDSFRFDRGPARWRHCVSRVCTFDYRDAQEEGLALVELFTSMPLVDTVPRRRYRVSAIMRNHSERLAYLDRVLVALDGMGSGDVFVHIFEANALTFLANFVRHPMLYLKYRKSISRRALPYDQYVDVLSRSACTIDYAHPRQTGITIRCFEALSAGTRIITNNPSVLKSAHFDSDNVIVFTPDTAASVLRQQVQALPLAQPAPRRRTVLDFLRELIGTGGTILPGHGPAQLPTSGAGAA